MVQDVDLPRNNWYRLTPDPSGSYIDGTWAQVDTMPTGYGPLFYASAVLADGRLVVEGGEYNLRGGSTDSGAIFDPTKPTGQQWVSVAPPAFFGGQPIADSPSVVLPDGRFMISQYNSLVEAILDPSTLTWTQTGTGKAEPEYEEGWTLLPNGKVLDVDTFYVNGDPYHSEIYDPSGSGSWSYAGSTVVQLWGEGCCNQEIGPAVLLPDGSVFATGATTTRVAGYPCVSGNTSIYNKPGHPNVWTANSPLPYIAMGIGVQMSDAPGALLPSGNVLLMTSPCTDYHATPSYFYEWNGSIYVQVPAPPHAMYDWAALGVMLVLPTGQVLLTDESNDIEI